MTLHLLKIAVGIDDLDDLRRVRAARAAERGGDWVYTRNRPRRAAEVLAGGSIYWVMRGQIRVRQRVTGFRSERDAEGTALLPDRGRRRAGGDAVAAVATVPGLALSVGRGGAAGRSRRPDTCRMSRAAAARARCSPSCARSVLWLGWGFFAAPQDAAMPPKLQFIACLGQRESKGRLSLARIAANGAPGAGRRRLRRECAHSAGVDGRVGAGISVPCGRGVAVAGIVD